MVKLKGKHQHNANSEPRERCTHAFTRKKEQSQEEETRRKNGKIKPTPRITFAANPFFSTHIAGAFKKQEEPLLYS